MKKKNYRDLEMTNLMSLILFRDKNILNKMINVITMVRIKEFIINVSIPALVRVQRLSKRIIETKAIVKLRPSQLPRQKGKKA